MQRESSDSYFARRVEEKRRRQEAATCAGCGGTCRACRAKAAKTENQRRWVARHSEAYRAYQAHYYETVTKPKRMSRRQKDHKDAA